MLQSSVIALLQRSPTFQQQCRRIAAVRVLRITLQVNTAVDAGAMAQTIITRYEAGGIRADVTLRFSRGLPAAARARVRAHPRTGRGRGSARRSGIGTRLENSQRRLGDSPRVQRRDEGPQGSRRLPRHPFD
jgi:hypothetical protein